MTQQSQSDQAVDERVEVSLGDRSYTIHIGAGLLGRSAHLLRPLLGRPRIVIITDENVAKLHLEALERAVEASGIAAHSITVPAGEGAKSYAGFSDLSDRLLAAGVERSDLVVAFGGGVIGDLAGFAASVLRRGVPYVQLPTTLLAQVDSSVGGKTGINSPLGKNLIGAFHQPRAVIADIDLLQTLPSRELRAGYAEIAKYGLLGDAAFFTWLESNGARVLAGDRQAIMHAIATSCRAKAAIVGADERESGQRALLNLGHTFAHALETATAYVGALNHGEAVSIGMVLAFRLSERLGLAPSGTAGRVSSHLSSLALPVDLTAIQSGLPNAAALIEIMRQDKKARAGRLAFVLARDIGQAYVEPNVPDEILADFLGQELAAKQ